MTNAMRAYLQTEGKLDYRQCLIAYYTYSMFDTPSKYRVNVNVHIQSPKKQFKTTLNIDNIFDKESDAINYGIEQGKKFIDANYESGKISFLNPETEKNRSKKQSTTTANKSLSIQKKDQK